MSALYASEIKRNLAYTLFLSLSQTLLQLITFPYASRILQPRGMGSIAFADSITQYLIVIAALGISVYGVKEVAKVRNDRLMLDKLFSELLTIHFITTLLCIGVYIALILSIDRLNNERNIFFIGCGILACSALQVEWFFQGIERFQYIAKRTVIFRIVTVLLLFVMVRDRDDGLWYYGLALLALAGSAVINLAYASKFVTFSWKDLNLKRHLAPLFSLFAIFIITCVYTVGDTILLGTLTDAEHVGYYSAALRIIKICSGMLFSLIVVLVPKQTIVLQENNADRIMELLSRSFQMIVFITVPLSAGLVVNASDVMMLLGGDKFIPASTVLQIASFTVIIIGTAHILSQQILVPMGKEKLVLRAVLIGAIVSLGVNTLLIPRIKDEGAAVGYLVSEFCVVAMLFVYARRITPLPPFFKQVACSLFSCLLFYPLSKLCSLAGFGIITRLGLTILLSGATYAGFQIFVFKNVLLVEEWRQQKARFRT